MRLSPPCLLLFLAPTLSAQEPARIGPFAGPTFAVQDQHRGCLVAIANVGGLWETWELHGDNAWLRRASGSGLAAPDFAFYDSVHARTCVYSGGSPPQLLEWDGLVWTPHPQPSLVPPARTNPAVAFDEGRGVAVVCGGAANGTVLNDHWEWNGLIWTASQTGSMPPRSGARMAYDARHRGLVLFGGGDPSAVPPTALADTWTFDGLTWNQQAGGPPARSNHGMAWHQGRQRVVMQGGRSATNTPQSDEWEWDGAQWTQVTALGTPPAPATLVPTPGGVTACFQDASGQQVWHRETGSWTPRALPSQPAWRTDHAVAYDSARSLLVLFGGRTGTTVGTELADTWGWNGDWYHETPAHAPSARYGHALAYDPVRGETVLFGGFAGGALQGDTWVYDGSDWIARSPATPPAPRADAKMTYDGTRGYTLLFGGQGLGGTLGDTWIWDGGQWVQAATTGPTGRYRHVLAHDPQRGVVLAAGGVENTPSSVRVLADTWEWDGATWTLRDTTLPLGLPGQIAWFDPQLGQVVAFRSYAMAWNGSTWQVVNSRAARIGNFGAGAYHTFRDRAILFAETGLLPMAAYGPTPASQQTLTAACGTPAPRLATAGRGSIGELDFHFEIDARQARAPVLLLLGLSTPGPTLGTCRLAVGSLFATLWNGSDALGWSRTELPLPDQTALRGVQLYAQAAALLPGGPVSGWALSDGIALRIGD